MKRIDVDFNAMTDDNRVILNTRGLQSIAGESLSEGERVVLSDEEVEVEAVVSIHITPEIKGFAKSRRIWLAAVDEKTWRDVIAIPETKEIPGEFLGELNVCE